MTTDLTKIRIYEVRSLPAPRSIAVIGKVLVGRQRIGMQLTDSEQERRWKLVSIGCIKFRSSVPPEQKRSLIALKSLADGWDLRPGDCIIEIDEHHVGDM